VSASDREYQVFIKPVGSTCNLRCNYCYYKGPEGIFGGTGIPVMSDSLLETFTKQNIEASGMNSPNFSWHGGEPTLAGIEFYRRAVAFQKRYAPQGVRVVNGIQTNGTAIDDDWCRFLAEEGFAVGISIDGTQELHDRYRKYIHGEGSFNKAVNAFRLLQKHGVEPEILCVVNDFNSVYPLEIYRFFKTLGAKWITFLPLVVRDDASTRAVSPPSVIPEIFGNFLCAIFDEWLEHDIGTIKVQIFEEAARVAFRMEHTLCVFKRECGGVPVVESNGDFYNCDHFVSKSYLAGNIGETELSDLLDSEMQRSFGAAKRISLPVYCLDCEVLDMCNGECPKNRFSLSPSGESGLNYLCAGYRKFFNHCTPFVNAIAQMSSQGR
jgi:uncharacterized protein